MVFGSLNGRQDPIGILVGIPDALADVESFKKRLTEQTYKEWVVATIVRTERGLTNGPD